MALTTLSFQLQGCAHQVWAPQDHTPKRVIATDCGRQPCWHPLGGQLRWPPTGEAHLCRCRLSLTDCHAATLTGSCPFKYTAGLTGINPLAVHLQCHNTVVTSFFDQNDAFSFDATLLAFTSWAGRVAKAMWCVTSTVNLFGSTASQHTLW